MNKVKIYNRRGGNRLTMTTAIHERVVDSPVELGRRIGGPEGILLLTASFIALFISRARVMVPRMQMVKVIVNIVQLIEASRWLAEGDRKMRKQAGFDKKR